MSREERKANKPEFKLDEHCFDKQLAFILDPAKFKTASCSRRAGKSEACAADLIWTSQAFPGTNSAYITLSKTSGKRIIWKILKRLNKEYQLDGKPNDVELTLEFPNGSTIYVSGAKDEAEIEKFRGMALKKVYIDEAQAFKSYLQYFIEDVLEPALMDYNGSLALIGTPNASCAGYFHDACHAKNVEFGWSNHHWTMHDNPWIEKKSGMTPEEQIRRICARRRVPITDPAIRREFFGEWKYDPDSLIYKYDPKINTYEALPEGHKWEYVLGIDTGFQDADALAVVAFSYTCPNVYLVEEIVEDKQDITSLIDQVKLLNRKYSFVKQVIDVAAAGKKVQEELRVRHNIIVEAAEKHRKQEYIELMNGDLRAGLVKVQADSQVADDWPRMEWDKSNPLRWKAAGLHSDIADALLYAWRVAHHYAYQAPESEIIYGSKEWELEEERKEADRFKNKQHDDWWSEGYDVTGDL